MQLMNDKLHYDVVGDGSLDILLLHGWASSSRIFNRLVMQLRDVGRFWLLDLPGLGQSPAADIPATVNTHMEIVRAFCHEHNLKPHITIGHSMGGMIALKLALAEPALFARQILICPVVTGDVGVLHIGQWLHMPPVEFVLRHSELFWQIARAPVWEHLVPLPWLSQDDHDLRATIWDDFRKADWATSIECLLSMTHENLAPDLHKINQPSLVIVGEQDLTVPPSEGLVAASCMPQAQLVRCPRARHLPHEEQPDIVLPAIRRFIQQQYAQQQYAPLG